MAYTDKQLMAFTQIAYMDLEDRVTAYKKEHPEADSVKLSDLHLTQEERAKLAPFADPSEYENWSISATIDNTGFGKSGMAACVIETSSGEPKEAAVAFRGSGDLKDPEALINDWMRADVGLIHSEQTAQEKDVEKFLKNNKGLLSQYGNLAMTGHSLGGALADYATVKSVELGLDGNITQCANMDGPGHSKLFISKNKEALEKVKNKMVHYKWSRVSAQMWNISGTEKYVGINDNYLNDGAFDYLGLEQHAPTAPVYNPDGSMVDSPAYKMYCDANDLGHNSRLLDGSLNIIDHVPITINLPFIGDVSFGDLCKWGSLLLVDFGVSLISIGLNAKSRYDEYCESWDYIWSEHFKKKKKKEREEKEAKKTPAERAADEADTSPGFYIDPKAYEQLVTHMINTISMLDNLETDLQTVGNYSFPLDILGYVTAFHGSTGNAGYDRRLNDQRKELKNIMDKGAEIKEHAAGFSASMNKMYAALNAIRIYLDGTSRNFTEAENNAISRISSWPK